MFIDRSSPTAPPIGNNVQKYSIKQTNVHIYRNSINLLRREVNEIWGLGCPLG